MLPTFVNQLTTAGVSAGPTAVLLDGTAELELIFCVQLQVPVTLTLGSVLAERRTSSLVPGCSRTLSAERHAGADGARDIAGNVAGRDVTCESRQGTTIPTTNALSVA